MKLFESRDHLKPSKNQYNAQSIEILKGLDPVKKRPGMYTDTTSPDHLACEVIDNCVDEAIAGFANRIDVILKKDNSLIVSDNGRGMPVDIHPEENMSGVELIMLELHAGAKFSNKDYEYSGGLHGVGVSVVNALSSRLSIHITRDGHKYHIEFENGMKSKPLEVTKKVPKTRSGTSIWFYPDPTYFEKSTFSAAVMATVLKSKAVLCKGLKTRFVNEITGEKKTWQYDHGLDDYLDENLNHEACIFPKTFTGKLQAEDFRMAWAVNWTIEKNSNPEESYVNLIPTRSGGTHVNGFRSGLLESLREFCKFQNLLPKGIVLAPEDIWQNIGYVLSVKLSDPQFSGQTKERLSSRHCAGLVNIQIRDAFSLYLNHNTELGESLAAFAIENARARVKKARKVSKKKTINGVRLPAKLSDCTSIDQEKRELFFVEGDSAGGSAKQARDRRFQAILPLRGKILNTWEVDSSAVLESREIRDISRVIGVMPGSDDISKLRYDKICILADADSDGLHIATLMCALFFRHFPKIVEKGHFYIAMPPLYRIDAGKEIFYALDDPEKDSIIKRLNRRKKKPGKINIQRFKGLGEMNPAQLKETTIAPDSRRLVQLTIDNDPGDNNPGDTGSVDNHDQEASQPDVHDFMDILLSKKRTRDRKTWIETKGDIKEIDS